MNLVNKEKMSLICCITMYYILLYGLISRQFTLYEKIWCIFCIFGQLLFIIKYVQKTKKQYINDIVDDILYYSMIFSIFVVSPFLVQILIFTLITILILRILYGECILNNSTWKPGTKLGYVVLFIFTCIKYNYLHN